MEDGPIIDRFIAVVPTIDGRVLVGPDGRPPIIEVYIDGSRKTHEDAIMRLGFQALGVPLSVNYVFIPKQFPRSIEEPLRCVQAKPVPHDSEPRNGHSFLLPGALYVR